jgi:hypothetical protein
MKNRILAVVLTLSVSFVTFPAPQAQADIWGGDVAVLVQILANALQQLAQLRQILSTGQDNLDLIRAINQGINDSLGLAKTINPNIDPGIYRDWQKVQDAMAAVGLIYGVAVPSKDFQIQKDADQSVAEAISLNNSLYQYTREIDDVGQQIETYSHAVSPGGAQKLTAQSLGVIVHVLNASLRAQATGLKLQAQNLAIQNRKDKELTKHILDTSDTLTANMKAQDTSFELPRF